MSVDISYFYLAEDESGAHISLDTGWSIDTASPVAEQPKLLLTLDMANLNSNTFVFDTSAVIPICTFVNSDLWWGRQSYSFDTLAKTVQFDDWAQTNGFVQQESDQLLLNSAPRHLALRPWNKEGLLDENGLIEELLGGKHCSAIGPQPIWINDPIAVECGCGDTPQFVLQLGYELEHSSSILHNEKFFIGESMLYFHACLNCTRIFVDASF